MISLMWRVANLVMGTCFMWAAAFQVEGPDHWIWNVVFQVFDEQVVYVSAGILCFAAAVLPQATTHWLWRLSSLSVILFSALFAVIYIFLEKLTSTGTHYRQFKDREMRELLGLSIVFGWLSVSMFCWTPRPRDFVICPFSFVLVVFFVVPLLLWILNVYF